MEQTISRIASSSSTTRIRSAGMALLSVSRIGPHAGGSESNGSKPESGWGTSTGVVLTIERLASLYRDEYLCLVRLVRARGHGCPEADGCGIGHSGDPSRQPAGISHLP